MEEIYLIIDDEDDWQDDTDPLREFTFFVDIFTQILKVYSSTDLDHEQNEDVPLPTQVQHYCCDKTSNSSYLATTPPLVLALLPILLTNTCKWAVDWCMF